MPPSKPLPSTILSAIGLASTGCGIFGPCLDYAVCLDYITYPTGQTGDTTDTGKVGPCLDYATTPTGDTGSAATPLAAPPPASVPGRAEILEQLATEGTLPDDVLRRLEDDPER